MTAAHEVAGEFTGLPAYRRAVPCGPRLFGVRPDLEVGVRPGHLRGRVPTRPGRPRGPRPRRPRVRPRQEQHPSCSGHPASVRPASRTRCQSRPAEPASRCVTRPWTTRSADYAKPDWTGRLAEKLQTYLTPAVLVIDDVGYLPLDRASAHAVFPLVSRRDERGSIVLTSTGVQRLGPGLLRRRPDQRHPGPPAAPRRRRQHQRTQLTPRGPHDHAAPGAAHPLIPRRTTTRQVVPATTHEVVRRLRRSTVREVRATCRSAVRCGSGSSARNRRSSSAPEAPVPIGRWTRARSGAATASTASGFPIRAGPRRRRPELAPPFFTSCWTPVVIRVGAPRRSGAAPARPGPVGPGRRARRPSWPGWRARPCPGPGRRSPGRGG